jgi:hypothetical protein
MGSMGGDADATSERNESRSASLDICTSRCLRYVPSYVRGMKARHVRELVLRVEPYEILCLIRECHVPDMAKNLVRGSAVGNNLGRKSDSAQDDDFGGGGGATSWESSTTKDMPAQLKRLCLSRLFSSRGAGSDFGYGFGCE